jgi:ferritin-like metal-binding protein YciE
MTMQSLEDLFVHTLRDVYNAEKQSLQELPRMAKKAGVAELRAAFDAHCDETRNQVNRLERIFEMMRVKPEGEACEALRGIVEEGRHVLDETKEGMVQDAGMIATAQAIEHYEIARYGTLCAWAKQLGRNEAADLLGETLKEEYNADKKLNEIAVGAVNRNAA